MESKVRSILIVVVLATGLVSDLAASAQERRKNSWSADLGKYGATRTTVSGTVLSGKVCAPEFAITASSEVVGVAIGKVSADGAPEHAECWSQPRSIFLVFFDAANGKLLAQIGPWTGASRFSLVAAPGNKFLFHYQMHHKINDPFSDFFVLASSSGSVLKTLELEPNPQRVRGEANHLLFSPGGAAVYAREPATDGTHCKVLQSESLTERRSWVEPRDSHAPQILAISDEEMLGSGERATPADANAAKTKKVMMLRPFDGDWHEFVLAEQENNKNAESRFSGSGYGSLGNHKFFALESGREGEILRILQADASILSTPNFPEARHGIWFPIGLYASQDGRYFGFMGTRENWGTHVMLDLLKMDDTFWSDDTFVYVWQTERSDPVARVELGAGKAQFAVLGGDFPGIAYVRGSTLKFQRVKGN
jgi:hypothetical protein